MSAILGATYHTGSAANSLTGGASVVAVLPVFVASIALFCRVGCTFQPSASRRECDLSPFHCIFSPPADPIHPLYPIAWLCAAPSPN